MRAVAIGVMPLLLAAARPVSAIDLETRLDGLEARLEALTRRVQAIEGVLKEGTADLSTPAAAKGEPVWTFDDYLEGTPLRVLQRNLDRDSGRLDLLLDVVSPLPDPAQWQELRKGTPVPLAITLWPVGDGAGYPIRLLVERATSIAPGSRIHLHAQVPADEARLVRKIRVGHVTEAESTRP
jgi:hypothetical protein